MTLLHLAGFVPQINIFATDLLCPPVVVCTCRPVRILTQWRSTHSTTVGTVGAHCTYPIDSNDFVGFGGTKTVSFQPRNLRLPIANRQALRPGSVILRTEIIQTISQPATARPGIPCGSDGSNATDRIRFIRVCFTADSRMILLLPSSWPFQDAHLPPGLFIAIGLHSCLFFGVWASLHFHNVHSDMLRCSRIDILGRALLPPLLQQSHCVISSLTHCAQH